jgi:hypothetical protein
MLLQGSYPAHLKARIRGGNGHLSNTQALELFKKYRPAFMSHLVLSHLSKNNNCPKLVSSLFTQHARGTEIVVASRYQETLCMLCRPLIADLVRYRLITNSRFATGLFFYLTIGALKP